MTLDLSIREIVIIILVLTFLILGVLFITGVLGNALDAVKSMVFKN